jgi:hypothetical protein
LGWCAVWLLLITIGQVQAGMPPEAQTAVSRGIKAAKQEHDYLLAIRYFQEARALVPVAPDAPDIFLNLGLAEGRLPGRELRAIGWLAAYLSASPNAANEGAVRAEIKMLDARNRSSLLRLIKTVQKAADLARFQSPWVEVLDRADLARDQSVAGDAAGAQEVFAQELGSANLMQYAPGRSFAQSALAEAEAEAAVAQAAAGDLAGAKQAFASALKSAGLVEDTILAQKRYTRAHIARNQLAAGDIVGALQTAELIEDATVRNFALELLPYALAQSGATSAPAPAVSPAPAEVTTMADAVLQHLAGIGDYRDLQAAAALLHEQGQTGWAAGDEATALLQRLDALRADAAATSVVENPDGRALQYSLGGHQVVDPGISVAGLEKSLPYRSSMAEAIAQNILAYPPEAKTEAALKRYRAWGNLINHAAPPARQNVTLADWLGRLDDGDPTQACALNTPPFLDLAACLKSLAPSADPQNSFEAPAAVIAKIASAQAKMDRMMQDLARQALDQTRGDAAEAQAKAGDLTGAQATAELILNPAGRAEAQGAVDQARGELAVTQAKAGDLARARQTAGLIREENRAGKTEAYGQIAFIGLECALTQVKAGELASALRTTQLIQDGYFLPGGAGMLQGQAWAAIALAQVKANELAAAQQSLGLAQSAGELSRDGDAEKTVQKGIDLAQEALAEAQVQADDLAGAQATVDQMRPDADSPQDKVRNSLVAAQVRAGDLAGAQATAAAMQDEGWKKKAEELLAGAPVAPPAEDAKP